MAEQTTPVTDTPDVLSEILAGDALTLGEVARKFPNHRNRGKCMDSSAVWRWMKHGSKAANGETVKLENCRVGNRQLTSEAALRRFIHALSAPAAPATAPTPGAAARRKRAAAASKKLAGMGA